MENAGVETDSEANAAAEAAAQEVTNTESGDGATPPRHEDGLSENPAEKDHSAVTLADLVDASLLSQLMEMGFSEARAGRALLATKKQANVEAALSWIEAHEDDTDIDEPLTEEQLAAHKPARKSPLTEQEAQLLARELQRKLREEREKREKEEKFEHERTRHRNGKAITEQISKLQEEARKRATAEFERKKEEAKKERERQRELLRQDYRERFGYEMPGDAADGADPEGRVAKMSGKDKVAFFSNSLSKRYKKEEPEKLLVCLKTLRVYIGNARDHPTEPKYHRIRKENAAFIARVLPCEGSLQLLEACGFKDQGDVLAIEGQPDGFVLSQAIKFLDLLIGQLRP